MVITRVWECQQLCHVNNHHVVKTHVVIILFHVLNYFRNFINFNTVLFCSPFLVCNALFVHSCKITLRTTDGLKNSFYVLSILFIVRFGKLVLVRIAQ